MPATCCFDPALRPSSFCMCPVKTTNGRSLFLLAFFLYLDGFLVATGEICFLITVISRLSTLVKTCEKHLREQQGRLKSFRSLFQLLILLNQWRNNQWRIRKLDRIRGMCDLVTVSQPEKTPRRAAEIAVADPAVLDMKGQLEKLR